MQDIEGIEVDGQHDSSGDGGKYWGSSRLVDCEHRMEMQKRLYHPPPISTSRCMTRIAA